MLTLLLSLTLTIAAFVHSAVVTPRHQECKCTPTDPCWPSEATWSAFNSSLSGRLIHATPPAAVCYPTRPEYNETACALVAARWTESAFHADDPISVDYTLWANDSCNPVYPNGTSVVGGDVSAGMRGCTQGRYPAYVVNVTEAEDVRRAFLFARRWGIRLNVKSTGHSLPGRSTAYGSLSIWTHHLRGIQFHDDFRPSSCNGSSVTKQMAVTVGAGEVGVAINTALNEYNAVISAGANPDVGIVGWFTGGGHGWLSSTHGMGADNVLEASIVTPQGAILTANACQNQDLFYAIRGGGGGTFGVVINATIKAFPSPQTTTYVLQAALSDLTKEAEWWELAASFFGLTPALKDGGAQGYIYHAGPPLTPTLVFYFNFNFYNLPLATVQTVMKPVEDLLNSHLDFVLWNQTTTSSPSFFAWYNATQSPETVAMYSTGLASRLLTRQSLSGNSTKLASVLREVGPSLSTTNNALVISNMVANSANRNLDVGMTPAWRDAVLHFLPSYSLPVGTSVQDLYGPITDYTSRTLADLEPKAGAYINEANPFEPTWPSLFFGPNYKRLRTIKQTHDPEQLLWCRSCVGSEGWEEDLESGLLCRVGGYWRGEGEWE